MMPDKIAQSNLAHIGQLALCFLLVGCHPMPPPGSGDPRLPAAFRTPQKTFETWKKATLAGDRETLQECYWEGLGEEELRAYLVNNLRPEAKTLFEGAELITVQAVTRVEINFTFQSPGSEATIRGVMVRTRHGWKVQHW